MLRQLSLENMVPAVWVAVQVNVIALMSTGEYYE